MSLTIGFDLSVATPTEIVSVGASVSQYGIDIFLEDVEEICGQFVSKLFGDDIQTKLYCRCETSNKTIVKWNGDSYSDCLEDFELPSPPVGFDEGRFEQRTPTVIELPILNDEDEWRGDIEISSNLEEGELEDVLKQFKLVFDAHFVKKGYYITLAENGRSFK